MSNTNPSIEAKWAQELYESRRLLQFEARQSLACRTKKQKIELVAKWKKKYSPITVNELLRVARNKSAAGEIANWDVDKM